MGGNAGAMSDASRRVGPAPTGLLAFENEQASACLSQEAA